MARRRQKRKTPPKPPTAIENAYAADIEEVTRETARRIMAALGPHGERWTRQAREARGDSLVVRVDSPASELATTIEGLRLQSFDYLSDEALEKLAAQRGVELNAHNREEYRKSVKRVIGFDIPAGAPHLEALVGEFIEDSVDLIQSIQRDLLVDVERTIRREWKVGNLWTEIAEDLNERFEISLRRGELIARDQLGKLGSALDRDRSLAVGVERFVWRTVRDGRVRTSHRRVNGRIYPLDTGHPRLGFPGIPVQCRCFQEPIFVDPETGIPETALGEPVDPAAIRAEAVQATEPLAPERVTRRIRERFRQRETAALERAAGRGDPRAVTELTRRAAENARRQFPGQRRSPAFAQSTRRRSQ